MKIIFNNDNRIFTLFCLLNKIGYDSENNSAMHPLRQKIRRELSASKNNLPNFEALFRKYHQSQILEAFLHFSEFPEFILKTEKWQTTLPKIQFLKAVPEIRNFYSKNNIANLYKNSQSIYNKKIKAIKQSVQDDIKKTFSFFQIKTSVKQIVLIPNFLDAYWRGYGPSINDLQYIIFGHCKTLDKFKFLIRHEFLHGLINPRIDRRIIIIANKLRRQMLLSENFKKQSYQQKQIIINEYIVRGLNLIYIENNYKKNIKELIAKEKQKGFILIKSAIKEIKKFK